MTRGKQQLVRDRVRLQNQTEALLEEIRIKLSGVVAEAPHKGGQSGAICSESAEDGYWKLWRAEKPIRRNWRIWATTA
jgi:hypothetical protein